MKKFLCMLLIGLNIVSVGCNNKTTNDKTVNSSNTTSSQEKEESQNSKDELQTIELNKSFNVKTQHGTYDFIIKGATKTDWWNRSKNNSEKTVILLNLECENIDFDNKDKTGFNGLMLYNAFTVKDENNYMLEHFSMAYDDINMGSTPVPKNTKSKISIPFIAENDIKTITVQFSDKGIIKNIPVND